jgi:hypothetical protein
VVFAPPHDTVLITDGGLATESEASGHNLSDDLWSALLLVDAPREIVDRMTICRSRKVSYTLPPSEGVWLKKSCDSCPIARPNGTPPTLFAALRGMPSKRQCTPR